MINEHSHFPARKSPAPNLDRGCFSSCVLRTLLLLAAGAFLPGCFERKQSAILNPDGSGKMMIETIVAVPAQGLPGKDKPTALSYGRLVAADLINNTRGVDAWSDLEISELDGGRARIATTLYFRDLNALKFDMPLVFTWKRNALGDSATFAIERSRTSVKSSANLSPADLKDMVLKAQAQYQEQQKALQLQLNAFTLQMSFTLPGEIVDTQLLSHDDKVVALTLDGKKAMQALDQFMADEAALTATFKAGEDLPANDDIMLQSMYGQPGPVSARVKLAPNVQPSFDYQTEVTVAQLRQADMLKEAGVDLLPKFIVKPASQPASSPATRPASGR